MNILFIVSLPPPMTGQALASQMLIEELAPRHQVTIINMSKPSLVSGIGSFQRIWDVLKILWQAARLQARADLVYLTISESRAGNLKDLCLFAILGRKLRSTVIHLQGGAGLAKLIAEPRSLVGRINRYFHSQLGAVVVEGKTQRAMFVSAVEGARIHVVPNFAQDALFVSEEDIRAKFRRTEKLRLLFLSNLIWGKGHAELLEAYTLLPQTWREKVALDFAGRFESSEQKQVFQERAKAFHGIHYHGVVLGREKQHLLKSAHVFVLPTYYPYEGQPLSILEAYASGCAVITTPHSGIPDVFADGTNGFFVQAKSVESLQQALRKAADSGATLVDIALKNRRMAQAHFTEAHFKGALVRIIEDLGGKQKIA